MLNSFLTIHFLPLQIIMHFDLLCHLSYIYYYPKYWMVIFCQRKFLWYISNKVGKVERSMIILPSIFSHPQPSGCTFDTSNKSLFLQNCHSSYVQSCSNSKMLQRGCGKSLQTSLHLPCGGLTSEPWYTRYIQTN